MAGRDTPPSPRLAALLCAHHPGDSGAVELFWQELADRGTPLVEGIDGDPDHVLVHTYRLASEILGNERDIWVYTPPAYEPTGGPYSLPARVSLGRATQP